MSDKIYRTVTFEIEPSGDCKRYKARAKSYNHCMAFNDFILANSAWNGDIKYYQLEKCKDYLSQEKAKVYCDGCKKLSKDKYSCALHLYSRGFTPNSGKPYRLNCNNENRWY